MSWWLISSEDPVQQSIIMLSSVQNTDKDHNGGEGGKDVFQYSGSDGGDIAALRYSIKTKALLSPLVRVTVNTSTVSVAEMGSIVWPRW